MAKKSICVFSFVARNKLYLEGDKYGINRKWAKKYQPRKYKFA